MVGDNDMIVLCYNLFDDSNYLSVFCGIEISSGFI